MKIRQDYVDNNIRTARVDYCDSIDRCVDEEGKLTHIYNARKCLIDYFDL